jgi:acetylornithine deacetylase/succinyl-diaminopimelate desuccinylase-like protein
VGEKGVFRFRLRTHGRAGHASIPRIGDNALMRMAEVLARLDGRQPPLDRYPEADAALAALLGRPAEDPVSALSEVLVGEPRFAYLLEPMLGVTVAPTMISASQKENVIPSTCSVVVDCRVPPGLGGDHVRRRVEELIGPEGEHNYTMRFLDDIIGNSSPLDTPLAATVLEFVRRQDADAELLPVVLPGFTDSHWFRRAFPECIAYGFFPQRAMSLFDTMPLVHAPDERIATEDVELASEFFFELAPRMLN